ncbi:MAG: hypothetical protein WDO70_09305 [Alphaproteobacteria bacterium]
MNSPTPGFLTRTTPRGAGFAPEMRIEIPKERRVELAVLGQRPLSARESDRLDLPAAAATLSDRQKAMFAPDESLGAFFIASRDNVYTPFAVDPKASPDDLHRTFLDVATALAANITTVRPTYERINDQPEVPLTPEQAQKVATDIVPLFADTLAVHHAFFGLRKGAAIMTYWQELMLPPDEGCPYLWHTDSPRPANPDTPRPVPLSYLMRSTSPANMKRRGELYRTGENQLGLIVADSTEHQTNIPERPVWSSFSRLEIYPNFD